MRPRSRIEIIVDDLRRASNDARRARALAPFPALALWLLRDSDSIDALLANFEEWGDRYVAVALAPSGVDAIARVWQYLRVVFSGHEDAIRARLKAYAPEVTEAAMTLAEELLEEGREQGREEGREQGREEARARMERVLLKQLTSRFAPFDESIRARVASGTPEELEHWLERVLEAPTLAAVFDG